MKKTVLLLTVMIAALSATPTNAADLEEVSGALEFDVAIDYYSHYIWRGQELAESSLQPGANISYGDLTFGFWGNVNLTDAENHQWEFTETDWSLDYTSSVPVEGFENVMWSIGMIYYNFGPTAVPDTTELYWGFGLANNVLNPYFTVYHDLDEAEGTYVNAGIAWQCENPVMHLTEDMPVGMEFGASLGWGNGNYNEYYWGGVDDGALNDLNLRLAFPTELGTWTLTPSVNYTMVVDSKLRDFNQSGYDQGYDDSSNYLYVGVGLAKSF